jgi:hypothetical protein
LVNQQFSRFCGKEGTVLGDVEGVEMKTVFLLAFAALLGGSGTATAQNQAPNQAQVVERVIKAQPNRDTQIGLYVNVKPDCTSGPLPSIRLASPPSSGRVVVKSGEVKATNYKACLALQVPAYVAFYKSQPDFIGDDALTIEVKYPQGRTEIQKITVSVVGPGAQQKI